MNSLHVHGKVTPTSKVVRSGRVQKSPFDGLSPTKKRPQRQEEQRVPGLPRRSLSSPMSTGTPEDQYASQVIENHVPVLADFRGLDILSAIDYLKALQSGIPTHSSSRERRTALLNRRRFMPRIVLAHQIVSLFPNMATLERETHHLIATDKIVALTLQNGEAAYLRTEDFLTPLPTPSCGPSAPAAAAAAAAATGSLMNLSATTEPSAQSPQPDQVNNVKILLERRYALDTLSDAQCRQFSASGHLIRRNGENSLSVPHLGTFFQSLLAARKYILAQLQRQPIVLEKNLKSRYELWKEGGVFHFESLMHDLVGSGRVEILLLTVGRGVKITKRGREDR